MFTCDRETFGSKLTILSCLKSTSLPTTLNYSEDLILTTNSNIQDESKSGKSRLYVLKRDPDDNGAIENELKMLNKLHHPNIIEVKCVISFNNHLGLLFDFMTHCDLVHSQQAGLKLSNEQIINLFRKLAKACEYCHKNGIIHADIKGDNILFNDNFEPVLADFGVSLELPTNQDFVIWSDGGGTDLFRAPEVLNDNRYSSKSDIWAFGLTLFESLYGYHPIFNSMIWSKTFKITEVVNNFILDKPYKTHESEKIPGIHNLLEAIFVSDYDVRANWTQILNSQLMAQPL